jgi:signal peptidase I
MEPTLQQDDNIVVLKKIGKFFNVKRGDIIVFKTRQGDNYIKRAIGLPGDIIAIKNNAVYLNGKLKREPYLNEVMQTPNLPAIRLPRNKYFVLGDNRNRSTDSRVFGLVDQRAILGKAVYRFYPIQDQKVLIKPPSFKQLLGA